jgi:hypothetical protein
VKEGVQNVKAKFVITAPAHLAFSGSRRNGGPIILPITRAEVARELLFARAKGWGIRKINNGYVMDTGLTYTKEVAA